MKKRLLRSMLAFGSAAKGVIYVIIGGIALNVALGGGGEVENMEGALLRIGSQPLGTTALLVLFLGLLCYALWRLTQAIFDPERLSTEPYGRWMRSWSGFVGALHLVFAYQVISHLMWGKGLSDEDRSSEQVQSWTSTVLSWPGGRWLIGAIGIAGIGFCVGQLIFAYRALYANALQEKRTGRVARALIIWLGRIGFASRALLAAVVGLLFLEAAFTANPSKAGGVSDAMESLLINPYGRWFLGADSVGLIAFGLFFWGLSRYQAVDQESKPPLEGRENE